MTQVLQLVEKNVHTSSFLSILCGEVEVLFSHNVENKHNFENKRRTKKKTLFSLQKLYATDEKWASAVLLAFPSQLSVEDSLNIRVQDRSHRQIYAGSGSAPRHQHSEIPVWPALAHRCCWVFQVFFEHPGGLTTTTDSRG